jgi:5'-3' exonuclease
MGNYMQFKNIVIVDLHSIMHNVKHGVGKVSKLKTGDTHTFVIYGFLMKLRNILKTVPNDVVVFACDSNISKRKKIYQGYKQDRTEKTEDQIKLDEISYPQFDIIKKEILPAIGYKNIFEYDGYEADDIIAAVSKKYQSMHNKMIVTLDKDMYQCLDDCTWIVKHDKMKVYSQSDFVDEYKIKPAQWADVKKFGGCTSDKVPGIHVFMPDGEMSSRNIGEKTALKYLRGELKETANTYKAFTDPRNARVLARNEALTVLPLKGTPVSVISPDAPSVLGMQSVIKRFRFKSFAQDFNSFVKYMRLR